VVWEQSARSRHGTCSPTSTFLSAGMGTVVDHPMFALGEIQGNMQPNSRRNSVEIIDVDAHDEASTSSSSQGPPRPRPVLRPTHSFHSDSIISLVDDSDDEVEILSDPIQGRLRMIVVSCYPLNEFARP
jgi:hypothetical protein